MNLQLCQTNQISHPKENHFSHRDLEIVCGGRRSREPRKSPDSGHSEDMYKTPLKEMLIVRFVLDVRQNLNTNGLNRAKGMAQLLYLTYFHIKCQPNFMEIIRQ